MKILRILLTALYTIFSVIGFGLLFTDKASFLSLIIALLYIAVGLALNNIGGRATRYLSYFTASILSLLMLGAVYAAISPFFGERFDLMLLITSFIIGSIGITTIFTLVKDNKPAHEVST